MAGSDSFCVGCSVGSGSIVRGPDHSLTAVRGTNLSSGAGCGGAYNYGSFYCADPAGCHTYAGGTVLTPGIRHRGSVSKPMNGYSTWGSTGAPSNCVWTSVYSVGGPVDAAAMHPDGIPVLDREATAAPAALAELMPTAGLKEARSFTTPAGDAWVLVDPANNLICLAVDDQGTGFGYSCQRTGDVRAAGTLATLEDGDATTGKGDLVIALAPEGIDALTVERVDGLVRSVPVYRGVAITTLTAKDDHVVLPKAQDAPAGVKARRFSAVS